MAHYQIKPEQKKTWREFCKVAPLTVGFSIAYVCILIILLLDFFVWSTK